MDRKLVIITIEEEYMSLISKQMVDIVGDMVQVRSITVKDLQTNTVEPGDIVLLSGPFLKELVKPYLYDGTVCLIGKRSVNIVNLKKVIDLSKGQHILVVNDNRINTEQTVETLQEIVFEHTYYPYYPDQPLPGKIDYVLTPGEKHLVPTGLAEVIDIGPRVVALETVYELFQVLGLEDKHSLVIKRYMKSLLSITKVEKQREYFRNITENANAQNTARFTFGRIVAFNPVMKSVIESARNAAKVSCPIYITGETGTGKSVIAEAIYNGSGSSRGPFLSLNCSTRTVEMLEKDLFGEESEEGCLPGFIERADGGTLLLKTVEGLSLSIQAKLLHLLETGEFLRKGGQYPVKADVRIITTSSEDLLRLVTEEKFRRDLYFQLSALTLSLPSLKTRKEDIVPLVESFKKSLNKEKIVFTPCAIESMQEYEWPGNVRELHNVVYYCVCLGKKKIEKQDLPHFVKGEGKTGRDEGAEDERIIQKIEEHGFLDESLLILQIFAEGKKKRESYGRPTVASMLKTKGILLTEQQLRMRLQVLGELGLLLIRQGRAGTTISRNGEQFLQNMVKT
ncbi:sigma 54-interacting transcriptional regulator [Fictibacillus terranigra]|uniref:Sigma 54-interacting transcriptional regulator n=1 Tax=Fictibacillus terranigra TaxID=3058424 RepID=A0ABT8EDF6_9BACL|nr:sigma 54-interacting transcriptional regulator [Fictibacillus sp. CENA-BCM004]MDN4075962.1 sigma 54-interacting transcriptional regulator [Fictibacillus sp. CENA-BCM004]